MQNQKRRISPAIFGLIILCFFLTFTTISCGNQEVAKLSTFDFVTGTTVGDEEIDANPLAIIAFLAAVSGVGFGFMKGNKKSIISAVVGGIGFISILVLKIMLDSKITEQGDGMLKAEYGPGYYLPLILFLGAAGFNIYLIASKSTGQLQGNTGAEGSHKFCTQCGSRNEAGNEFCTECGNKFILGG